MVQSEISLVVLCSVNQSFVNLFQDWFLAGRNQSSLVDMLLVTRYKYGIFNHMLCKR